MPHASIVVPAFNAAATLSDTLTSLSSQTYRDFEIIVVDDGSTDTTATIARRHAHSDPRIKLVQQINRGLAGARNTGIAHSLGAVVGFCDADDLWLPEKLATHVAHLDGAPDVGISYSGSNMIDDKGKPIGHAQRPRLRNVTSAHVFKRNPIGNGSAPVIRREALQALAWCPATETRRDWVFDETFRQSEDIECWLRLCVSTDWIIEGVPGLLTEYRVNDNGLSANTTAQLASWERMVEKLRPFDPVFFDEHTPAAKAYQLRYLARRAISGGDGETANTYLTSAFGSSTAPLREEPLRTLTTWVAAKLTYRFGTAPLRIVRNLLLSTKSA